MVTRLVVHTGWALLARSEMWHLVFYDPRWAEGRWVGSRAKLTLVGRLPLAVLGIGLVQVGEAGPQLQDAV